MSGNNLTVDGQLRYIIQWFNEWSELQREDFLPILIEYLTKDPQVHINGVVSDMAAVTCNDKPMSLFQCRIKLFKEWSRKWPEDEKIMLKEKIIEIDPKIGEKLQEELSPVVVETTNGTVSPIHQSPIPPTVEPEIIPVIVNEEVPQNA